MNKDNESLNEALGVSDERNTHLQSTIYAAIYLDCLKQKEGNGYDICQGVKDALPYATTTEEIFCLGATIGNLEHKLDAVSISAFLFMVGTEYVEGDTIGTLAPKLTAKYQQVATEANLDKN